MTGANKVCHRYDEEGARLNKLFGQARLNDLSGRPEKGDSNPERSPIVPALTTKRHYMSRFIIISPNDLIF